MSSIKISKFNPAGMFRHATILIIGKRNTGKSCLVKDLLSYRKDFKIGKVFSKTDHLSHFYDEFIPSSLISKGYSKEEILSILERQTKWIKEKDKDPSMFLLLDDILSEKRVWSKDPNMEEILFNGRHYKLFMIITSQDIMGLPPSLRQNLDYIFILKNNNISEREKIYKYYAGMFDNKHLFYNALDKATENYGALVIDTTGQSNELKNIVFYYRASLEHKNLRLCHPSIWKKEEERKDLKKTDSNTLVISSETNKFRIKKF